MWNPCTRRGAAGCSCVRGGPSPTTATLEPSTRAPHAFLSGTFVVSARAPHAFLPNDQCLCAPLTDDRHPRAVHTCAPFLPAKRLVPLRCPPTFFYRWRRASCGALCSLRLVCRNEHTVMLDLDCGFSHDSSVRKLTVLLL